MKIHPVLLVDRWMDGQTDLTKLIVAFTILRTYIKMVKTVCIGHGICLCRSVLTGGWTDTDRHKKANICFLKFFKHS